MRALTLLIVVLLTPLACTAQNEARHTEAANSITAAEIRQRIGILAHDSMRGRITPSPELDEVAAYIASEFRRLGLEPGGDDGSFVQRYPLAGVLAPNVAGIMEGSDPALNNQYIVYSAHMDHLGVGPPMNGDSIYNGADDDASGTAAIIELAEAFTMLEPRPRRSMIFLTVSGEERGLLGSTYFATHPPIPITQMVANINIDMIGRNWTDTVVVIGKEHSDLGRTVSRVAARHPELGMSAVADIWPQERYYFRSDHYNFAKRGVPILFFFNGTHEDYHRPSDHVEKIDAEKASRIVKLTFYLGLEVANEAKRPKWNPESYERIVRRGRR